MTMTILNLELKKESLDRSCKETMKLDVQFIQKRLQNHVMGICIGRDSSRVLDDIPVINVISRLSDESASPGNSFSFEKKNSSESQINSAVSFTSASPSKRGSRSSSNYLLQPAQSSSSTEGSESRSSSSRLKIKGILKSPTPVDTSKPTGIPSGFQRPRSESILETAKETTLNFLLPARKIHCRERILREAYDWWTSDDADDGVNPISTNWNTMGQRQRIVRFAAEKVTIPNILRMERRKSIDDEVHMMDDGNYNEDGDQSEHHAGSGLPSMQLRRWKRVGRIMGVAIGLRIVSQLHRTTSDPELETSNVDETMEGFDDDSYLFSQYCPTPSAFSLDANFWSEEEKSDKKIPNMARMSSDTQSDSIVQSHSQNNHLMVSNNDKDRRSSLFTLPDVLVTESSPISDSELFGEEE